MDRIRIENLEVYCHHGLLREETVLGQKFLVSLDLYTDTREAGRSDDLSCSIDYAEVSHFVDKKMKERNFKLIEAAAEQLAADILGEFPLVQKICVELKKPWAPILLPLEHVSVSIVRQWTGVYLSVGSNVGNREGQIREAVEQLSQCSHIRKVRMSELIETRPYGYQEQGDFLNGAIALETTFSPEELLGFLHGVEKAGHRERTVRWGPRTIDLDIIFFGDEVVDREDLVIPHRDMHRREFVLEPLAEIAPWQKHPVFHKTVYELLWELRDGCGNTERK